MLVARLVFLPPDTNPGIQLDSHDFTLPGVTLDKKQGIFYAPSHRTGELIPVAKFAKALFFKTIKILPNAVIRISHYSGQSDGHL